MLDNRNIRLALSPLTRNRYGRIREEFDSIANIESRLTAKIGEAGSAIARDVWSGFFDPSAEIDAQTSGTAMRRLADWASDAINRSEPGADLIAKTTGSTYAAAEATEIMATLIESLDLPAPDERVERSEMTRESDGASMSLSRDGSSVTIEQSIGGKASTRARDFASDSEASAFVQEAIAQASARGFGALSQSMCDPDFEAAIDAALDEIDADPIKAASISNRVAKAIGDLVEDLDDTEAMLAMAYGNERGAEMFDEPTADDRREVDAMMSSKGLRDFLQSVGRFLDMMRSSDVPERVKGGLVIDGIEAVEDFGSLLADEIALLAEPALRSYQISRIVSGEASGYRYAHQGSREAGPYHVALDRSASMDRFGIAPRAFAMASVLMAVDSERDVSMSVFDSGITDVPLDFSTPATRLASIRAVLGIRNSGGTDFRPVVERADALAPATDLLLISDGSGPIDEDRSAQVFAERNLSYLVIGPEHGVNPVLRQIAGDRFLRASSLTSEAVSLAAFASK